jgi:hypothetical protein
VELSGILVVSRKEHHKGWWGNFGFRISDLNAENAESTESRFGIGIAFFAVSFSMFLIGREAVIGSRRGTKYLD